MLPNNSYIAKSATVLPADPNLWGQDVQAEAINRLPALQSFLQYAKIIYHDQNGDGMVLVTLKFQQGQAYLPVVIREWKMQPIDVIIYKQRKDVKYKYLGERNLINLANEVGMGTIKPVRPFGSLAPINTGLNLTTPADGMGGRMPLMPGLRGAALNKSASEAEPLIPTLDFIDYCKNYIKENFSYWKNTKLASIIDPVVTPTENKYKVITIDPDTGVLELMSDKSTNPIELTDSQMEQLFATAYPDPVERFEKSAGFLTNSVQVVGNIFNRNGNIRTQYENTALQSDHGVPPLPSDEGCFYYDGYPIYINPHVTYLDGSPYSFALGVVAGACCLSKAFNGFKKPDMGEGADLSKEDLLPEAKPEALVAGQTITIYDGRERSVSVPLKVVFASRTAHNIAIKVAPLFGDVTPVTLLFYSGIERMYDPKNPNILLIPQGISQILLLPDYDENLTKRFVSNSEEAHSAFPNIVEITKGGGRRYSVMENGHYLGISLTYPQLVFRMIRRYGFSDTQTAKFLKSLDTEFKKSFSVRSFLDEDGYTATPTGKVTEKQRKTAHAVGSISQSLTNINNALTMEDIQSAIELDNKLSFVLHKTAADADAQADKDQATNGPVQQQRAPGFMDAVSKTVPVAKDTQEVIDLLNFYAMGKIRSEEITETLTKLENSLSEAEGYLCKTLLLVQLGRIPAIQYSDIKILLSAIDSQISSVVSSRVLAKSNIGS